MSERTHQEGIEIEDQIHAFRARAATQERELDCRNASDSGDAIGVEIQCILQETCRLEQEIQSGVTGAPETLSNQPLYGR